MFYIDSAGKFAQSYGNPQIVPLIGGSGGFREGGNPSDGGGGGAILIACSNSIHVDGSIDVLGGTGVGVGGQGGANNGSGGAVRLIASQVTGSGQVKAVGAGIDGYTIYPRIRIETNSLGATLQTFPETIGVPPANPPILWPAANSPTARVVSGDAVAAPLDPHAPLVAVADVAIQNCNEVDVRIRTTNFPIEGAVQLFITPKSGNRITMNATRLSGDITASIWRVQTTLPQGFVTLQARATQP